MKTYLISLAAVAAVAAITGLLSPGEGRESGVRFLTRLCVLLVVAVPLVGGIRAVLSGEFSPSFGTGGGGTEEYEKIWEESYRKYGAAYLARTLTEQLAERYEKDPECFSVRFSFSEDRKSITEVTVLLSGNAVFLNTYDLEAWISKRMGCPCHTAFS